MNNSSCLVSKLCLYFYRKRIQRKFKLANFPFVKRPFHLRCNQNISLGSNFCANENVVIEVWDRHGDEKYESSIKIMDNVFVNRGTHISIIGSMYVGNNVCIGSYVSIIDNNHGECKTKAELELPPSQRRLFSKGDIFIDDNVWICDKVTILGGVKIGKGAVIAANAVVTKDVEPYTVVGGIPAKPIRKIM